MFYMQEEPAATRSFHIGNLRVVGQEGTNTAAQLSNTALLPRVCNNSSRHQACERSGTTVCPEKPPSRTITSGVHCSVYSVPSSVQAPQPKFIAARRGRQAAQKAQPDKHHDQTTNAEDRPDRAACLTESRPDNAPGIRSIGNSSAMHSRTSLYGNKAERCIRSLKPRRSSLQPVSEQDFEAAVQVHRP